MGVNSKGDSHRNLLSFVDGKRYRLNFGIFQKSLFFIQGNRKISGANRVIMSRTPKGATYEPANSQRRCHH